MIHPVSDPIIEIHDLTVTYQTKPVLWGIDVNIPKGSLIGIIGPNGAGKSTLIKTMMGLVPLSSGFIKIFDKPFREVRKWIAYVPQRGSVDWDFPASVLDVVMMGRYAKLGLLKRIRKADKEIVMTCLEQVDMLPFANRQIGQLSGGQQQRVFLARALAQEAKLYFMDEPFTGVDATTEKVLVNLLQTMSKQKKTVIVVHHDLQSVASYFDWIMLLNMQIIASGPTASVFTKELLQKTYGGKLTLLNEVTTLLNTQGLKPREDK